MQLNPLKTHDEFVWPASDPLMQVESHIIGYAWVARQVQNQKRHSSPQRCSNFFNDIPR